MIDQKRLRELVKLMKDNDLTELDLQDKIERVCLKRSSPNMPVQMISTPSQATGPLPEGHSMVPSESAHGPEVTIESPMVGTFYVAPTPESEPFAKIGDHVETETVVCIIEAMKVFNEIKAERTGTIEKVLVENGQAIEFGQPLFQLRPD